MTGPDLRGRLAHGVEVAQANGWSTRLPVAGAAPPRLAAVLMLFTPGADGQGEVLLTQRAAAMRSHPGQVAFPGGSIDATDDGPVAAALREAREETGLDPAAVEIVGTLPDLYLPPTNFRVTPVVGWQPTTPSVGVTDPREVARVAPVSLPALLDPTARFTTVSATGHRGPAFEADGFFVWGFTAGLLDQFITAAGMTIPWNRSVVRNVPGR